jgi:hypothetical protein
MARVHTQVALTKLLATSTQMQLVTTVHVSMLLTAQELVEVTSSKMRVVTVTIRPQFLMLETLNSISQAANKPSLYRMV